jgi:spore maturation protein CgeB
MNFEVYNKGESNLKVAFFTKNTFGNMLSNDITLEVIAKFNNIEIHVFDVDFLDSSNSLRKSYKEHLLLDVNQKMKEVYAFINEYLINNNIHISIFFGSGYPWTASFLEKIKKTSYIACYLAEDPEGARRTSQYYVKNYHYAFCGGIFFNKTKRIEEKYREWGARKSKFIPLGVGPVKRAPVLPDLFKRDIDIIYVGGAYLKKIIRIFKMKKHFGNRMLIYGRCWNYNGKNIFKTIIAKMVKSYYNIPEIDELPEGKLAELYRRTKIGFNIHLSYGPSNQRTYELPANGVMQICDCREGLSELYELNKEVVFSDSVDDAIKKIEYYLVHDEERISIARNGYKRVIENYRAEQSYAIILEEIKKDIKVNFKLAYLL